MPSKGVGSTQDFDDEVELELLEFAEEVVFEEAGVPPQPALRNPTNSVGRAISAIFKDFLFIWTFQRNRFLRNRFLYMKSSISSGFFQDEP